MKKVVVAVPHSHTWLWSQTCIASLIRNPPRADGCEVEVVVIDNSPWSPAIRGITDTSLVYDKPADVPLTIIPNHKTNRFHASALDCMVENYEFDYLMTLETDVLALRPTWLQWFVDQMRATDFAVGMWHHEKFINPSCTLYRGDALRTMSVWCKHHPDPNVLRWGPIFGKSSPLDNNLPMSENPASVLKGLRDWIAGPFAEKRGWPVGTKLREEPSGQYKGPGWYEPGQQLHHWAVDDGYTYTVCETSTHERQPGLPIQTVYGSLAKEYPELLSTEFTIDEMTAKGGQTVHMWGGTRALDILKHPVTCEFVKSHTPWWLAREARIWREVVPLDVQAQTLDLIRKYGWHYTGQGSDHISDRDLEASEFVRTCYREGGVDW